MCPSALSVETITAGETTYEEVMRQCGPPDEEYTQAGIRYLLYQSSPIAYDGVGIRDDKVILLAIYLPEAESMLEEYMPGLGEPDLTYFSAYAHGARSLAYPQNGITFVVTAMNVVVQVIYTPPMSKAEYQAQFGVLFPTQNPFGRDS
jgi:hypothetical protein